MLTIDDLPDDVLLEIFAFYVVRLQDLGFHQLDILRTIEKIESWQLLVHVCRRWRSLVFGSPRHLNLQLCCYTHSRFARKIPDVWPAVLPLIIQGDVSKESVDDVIAVLEHSDRISNIRLGCCTGSQIEKLWTAMQVPFPELVDLYLSYNESWSDAPILPDSFLGGSAHRLRHFYLRNIPSPGLPNLLSSATHLVNLALWNIPHSGCISPETMASCLSMLTSLETLRLESEFYYPYHDNRRPLPPTHSVLPTLTTFSFNGENRYLQELAARIDAPRLSSITFSDNIDFDTPELNRFISRTPILGAYDEARLNFLGFGARVRLRQTHPEGSDHSMVKVKIWGNALVWQLSTVAKICTLSLRTTENLYIDADEDPIRKTLSC